MSESVIVLNPVKTEVTNSPNVVLNTPDSYPIGSVLGTDGQYRLLVSTDGASDADGSSPALDSFGRSRMSTPASIFDSKQVYDNQPLLFSQYTSGGGGITYNNSRSSSSLTTGLTSGDRALRQTKRYFNYQPGKSQLIFCTFNMHGAVPGTDKQVGYFDDENGIFIRLNSGGYHIVKRSSISSPHDTIISQADWNIDKLDGTGPSGVSLNANAAIILVIDFEWLGVGCVRVGFDFGGRVIYAHKFTHSNVITSVYMRTPNLPVRWEIVNTGNSSGVAQLEAICCSVQSEGGANPLGVQRTASRGVAGASITTTPSSVFSIRLKPGYNRSTVFPLNGSVVTTDNGINYFGQMILNPTFGGSLVWNDVSNSTIQFSNTVTTTSNGTVLSEFYGIASAPGKSGGASVTTTADLSSIIALASDYAGTQDVITLSVRTLSGSSSNSIFAYIDWLELL